MFSRREHEIKAVLFPQDWSENLKQILLNIYGDQCIKEEKTFEVYGFSYPSEVVLIISYVGLDKFTTPVSFFLSCDLSKDLKSDEIINDMFDSAGIFFDTYFAKEESEIDEDFINDWQESEFNNRQFYYKVTRENVGLTIQADILLGE